jgi:hypothetical protein
MKGITILERIIAEEGSCCWANSSICKNCPLGRLERYNNGGYMSCVEAIGVDGLNEEEADAKYKGAAINKLTDLIVDNLIKSD